MKAKELFGFILIFAGPIASLAFAQPFSVGVVGGVNLTSGFPNETMANPAPVPAMATVYTEHSSHAGDYLVGIMAEELVPGFGPLFELGPFIPDLVELKRYLTFESRNHRRNGIGNTPAQAESRTGVPLHAVGAGWPDCIQPARTSVQPESNRSSGWFVVLDLHSIH